LNGTIQALAKATVVPQQVTGIVEGTARETTAQDEGGGQATRKRKITEKPGKAREIEVTVYGRKLLLLIEATTKIPLAAKVVTRNPSRGVGAIRVRGTWVAYVGTSAQPNFFLTTHLFYRIKSCFLIIRGPKEAF